jgi:ABC-2 type transport system ATP-binding protein
MSEHNATGGIAVEAQSLNKSFGQTKALDGFDLALPRGEVIGLVGPNGAGKTTLLLILASLLAPDSGSARVEGADVVASPLEVHGSVGWMPDFFGVYDDLTVVEYVELFAQVYRMSPQAAQKRARELLEEFRIEPLTDARVHTLSRGQKQKLGFARALVHAPSVLLLDEPASGVDPQGRIDLRGLVRRQAAAGTTVLVSSHILQDLEEMADRIAFVHAGRCQRISSIDDLPRFKGDRQWRIKAIDRDRLMSALTGAGLDFTVLSSRTVTVALRDEDHAAELSAALVQDGVRLVEFAPAQGAVEEAFMSLGSETQR